MADVKVTNKEAINRADAKTEAQAMKSDFNDVVSDIAEELVARLNIEPDGTVIDMFQTGSLDPWQMIVYFSALEKALLDFRTDKRKKTVIVQVQSEELRGIGRVVTPMTTLIEHLMMLRIDDMAEGRLELGQVLFSGENIEYEGVNLKGRHVLLLCDLVDGESEYLQECIKMCKEMKAAHVVAVPLMLWNPDLIDNLTEDAINMEMNNENRILS